MEMITNVVNSSTGIIAWDESGATFTVTRDANGHPTHVLSRRGKWIDQESFFKYSSTGKFIGILGKLDTAMLPTLLADALDTVRYYKGVTGGSIFAVGSETFNPYSSDKPPVAASFNLPGSTTNSQSVPATQYWSDDNQFSLAESFYWVAPVFANFDTTQSITIDGFKVASAATDKAVQNTLTWAAGTVGGAASFTLAAATTGAGGQAIPSFAVADPVPLASLARSDTGTQSIVRILETLATNGSARTIAFHGKWGSALASINSDAANGGIQVAGFMSNNANWVATPAAITPSAASYGSCVMGVLYGTGSQRISGAAFGDSRDFGTASTSGYTGWPSRVNWANGKVSLLNFGNASQKTIDSIAVAKSFINAYKPAFVTIPAWSPNDGSSLAQANAAWGAVLAFIEWCRQRAVVVVLRTPVSTSAASYPYGLTMFQRVLSLKQSKYLVLCDMTSVVSDGAFNTLPSYDPGDHLHVNDAGYQALANAFISQISRVF